MQLTHSKDNAAARTLYEKFGFAEFGVNPRGITTASGYVAKAHMWLDVTEDDDLKSDFVSDDT